VKYNLEILSGTGFTSGHVTYVSFLAGQPQFVGDRLFCGARSREVIIITMIIVTIIIIHLLGQATDG
jgi:hypothetical protein